VGEQDGVEIRGGQSQSAEQSPDEEGFPGHPVSIITLRGPSASK
jgi:hypothetical protein